MSLAKNRLKSHGLTSHGSKATIDLRKHTHQKMQRIKSLFACIRGKTCKIALLLTMVFPVALNAQQSIECQILRQQIMQLVNSGDKCQQLQNQCMALVAAGREMKSSCDVKVGACRMGEGIGQAMGVKTELEQKIDQYKTFCGG